MKKVVLVLVVLLGVLAALLLGGAEMLGYSGFGMGSGMMTGIGGMVAPIFLFGIIAFGVLLVFSLSHPRTRTIEANSNSSSASALDVSKMRYARGEITKEQYDAIKHDLGK